MHIQVKIILFSVRIIDCLIFLQPTLHAKTVGNSMGGQLAILVNLALYYKRRMKGLVK